MNPLTLTLITDMSFAHLLSREGTDTSTGCKRWEGMRRTCACGHRLARMISHRTATVVPDAAKVPLGVCFIHNPHLRLLKGSPRLFVCSFVCLIFFVSFLYQEVSEIFRKVSEIRRCSIFFRSSSTVHWIFRPCSTVHCIYGFFPSLEPGQNPGQNPGQKPGRKSGQKTCQKSGQKSGQLFKKSIKVCP